MNRLITRHTNRKLYDPTAKRYEKYAERVVQFRKNPPGPNWDGVTTFDEK